MAFSRYFLLTCCALAQAIDDGTEMLQVVSADGEQSSAISTVMTTVIARDLLWLGAIGKEANRTGMLYAPPDTEDSEQILNISKTGLDLVVGAMREVADDQLRMAKEAAAALEAIHAHVGPGSISIEKAKFWQLDVAKVLILDLLAVFEKGWSRYGNVSKKNVGAIHEFYTRGEGSQIPNTDERITNMMSPDKVDKGMSKILGPFYEGMNSLTTEATFKTLKEERKQELHKMRKAFLKLQRDVDEDQEKVLEGRRTGKIIEGFGKISEQVKTLAGKDVLDKCMEAIKLSWQMAEQTEKFTAMLANLVVE